jgi:hypothetical protein
MDSTEELEQSAHMAIVVEEQMDLHVTKVSDRTSDTYVFQTFSEYGKIIWLRKVEFVSMGTRSYLIAFRDEKDGEKAMREMNGMRVKGNHWKITRTQLSESHLSSKAIRTPSYCFGTVSSDCPRDITRIERNFNTTEYLRIQERAGYGTYGKNVALLPIPVHSSIAIAEWFVAGPLNCLPWQRQVVETFSSSPCKQHLGQMWPLHKKGNCILTTNLSQRKRQDNKHIVHPQLVGRFFNSNISFHVLTIYQLKNN